MGQAGARDRQGGGVLCLPRPHPLQEADEAHSTPQHGADRGRVCEEEAEGLSARGAKAVDGCRRHGSLQKLVRPSLAFAGLCWWAAARGRFRRLLAGAMGLDEMEAEMRWTQSRA